MTDELARAAQVLTGASQVALACHVNPDADALGSMLGLAHVLEARGVATSCSVPNDPFLPPRWARVLPGVERLVPASDFPEAPTVLVTFDCASLDRLQSLTEVVSRASEVIWIDHHRSNEGLGTISVVDPEASSTCEMVVRVIDAMGAELTDEAAACLYAGIVTDTGRFQYEATTAETLRVAARLRERPFDHAAIAQAMYEDNVRAYLDVVSVAAARVASVPSVDLIWTYVTQADLRGAGADPEDTEDLIDLIRTDRAADVAALLKQQRDGRYKVSMRSRGGHDLASVAARFGGGGHRLAAGYTSAHGPVVTIEELVAALDGEPDGL